jgi:hypothetical protein
LINAELFPITINKLLADGTLEITYRRPSERGITIQVIERRRP